MARYGGTTSNDSTAAEAAIHSVRDTCPDACDACLPHLIWNVRSPAERSSLPQPSVITPRVHVRSRQDHACSQLACRHRRASVAAAAAAGITKASVVRLCPSDVECRLALTVASVEPRGLRGSRQSDARRLVPRSSRRSPLDRLSVWIYRILWRAVDDLCPLCRRSSS